METGQLDWTGQLANRDAVQTLLVTFSFAQSIIKISAITFAIGGVVEEQLTPACLAYYKIINLSGSRAAIFQS